MTEVSNSSTAGSFLTDHAGFGDASWIGVIDAFCGKARLFQTLFSVIGHRDIGQAARGLKANEFLRELQCVHRRLPFEDRDARV